MDYVGNQRSPLWDDMEQMTDENTKISEEIEQMNKQVESLMAQKVEAERINAIKECYMGADPDGTNALTMKPLVAKLSGFAKFELDRTLTKDQFVGLMATIYGSGETFDQEKYDSVTSALSQALKDGTVPFQGDLENQTYKDILQAFRDYNPSVSE